jgi:hypothetical protein
LKHSKTATDNFNQLRKETDIDIAFIQEPYVYQNQVTGISRNYKVFTCGNGRKRAAVVVVNETGLSVLWVAYATHSTLKLVPTLPR